MMDGKPMASGAMTPNAIVIFTRGVGKDVYWWDWKKSVLSDNEWAKLLREKMK